MTRRRPSWPCGTPTWPAPGKSWTARRACFRTALRGHNPQMRTESSCRRDQLNLRQHSRNGRRRRAILSGHPQPDDADVRIGECEFTHHCVGRFERKLIGQIRRSRTRIGRDFPTSRDRRSVGRFLTIKYGQLGKLRITQQPSGRRDLFRASQIRRVKLQRSNDGGLPRPFPRGNRRVGASDR